MERRGKRRGHLHDGQYLNLKKHLRRRVRDPGTFSRLGSLAESKGFHQVVSSPLSRSSYHAEQAFEQAG